MADGRSSGRARRRSGSTSSYFEVTYVEKPVVSGVAPDGTISDTNQPVILWGTTLDADGGPQHAARIKIFTAAQYGAGGFDPALSAPTIDSGDIFGTADSWTVSQILPDGTYRAYVSIEPVGQRPGARFELGVPRSSQSTWRCRRPRPWPLRAMTPTQGRARRSRPGPRFRQRHDRPVRAGTFVRRRYYLGAGPATAGCTSTRPRRRWLRQADTNITANATSHSVALPAPPGGYQGQRLADRVFGYGRVGNARGQAMDTHPQRQHGVLGSITRWSGSERPEARLAAFP